MEDMLKAKQISVRFEATRLGLQIFRIEKHAKSTYALSKYIVQTIARLLAAGLLRFRFLP